MALLSRRAFVAGAPLLLALPTSLRAAPRDLSFAVFRNGQRIGEHLMTFSGEGDTIVARTEVRMTVKVGPIPVYRYRHTATERWEGERFVSLETTTDGNGKRQSVSARATPDAVLIRTAAGSLRAPANAAPLTHWNTRAFRRPLFNPQEGKLLKVVVTQPAADHWKVRGEAEIDNFYDPSGAWRALQGRLEDKSKIEYRRT